MDHLYFPTVSASSSSVKGRVSSPSHDLGYHTLLSSASRHLQSPLPPATLDALPDDVLLRIFGNLSSNTLCMCARVCRRWYFLAWEPRLWTAIALTSPRIHVDRGLKTLFRLLCRDSAATTCLAVERMSLSGCVRLTDKGLSTIARRCPSLRALEIRGCAEITDVGLSEVVAKCSNLERLDLTGCCQVTGLMNPRISIAFEPFRIQYLDLTDCQALSDPCIKQVVRFCPLLSHLYLRRCVKLTDTSIKYIASYCPGLKELSISDCLHMTDFGLYELAKLGPSLRYLSVAKCERISDAGIQQIARRCYRLRYLNVRGCEAVSDRSMELLARCCSRLRALDIGKCDVTDRGLQLLAENCPNLRKLSVKSCEIISDRGIRFIAYFCRGLQQLNLQDCCVTIEAYRTIKKFCRKCVIEHTNPGFC